MPVQATVMMFGFSIVPQLTMVGGTGARRVEPFQNTFAIFFCLSMLRCCFQDYSRSCPAGQAVLLTAFSCAA